MIEAFVKKYLAIVFVLATLMGVFHQHHDLKPHNDCQICTIASEISNADTPSEKIYLTQLNIDSESILVASHTLVNTQVNSTLNARAPPQFS